MWSALRQFAQGAGGQLLRPSVLEDDKLLFYNYFSTIQAEQVFGGKRIAHYKRRMACSTT